MTARVINIFEDYRGSARIRKRLVNALTEHGFEVADGFAASAELIICIGGDGTLLRMLAKHDFPRQPIVGVNTGRLGFFQELDSAHLDSFIESYIAGEYSAQRYRTVKADVIGEDGLRVLRVRALNEVVIRGGGSHLAHLNIHIGDSFIEKFCGDGIVISTPAGSTAYNYSLGGGIVDPRINLLQVTPIAPINSTAYRSFTSGVLLPQGLPVNIFPEHKYPLQRDIIVTADGVEYTLTDAKEIRVGLSRKEVTILRSKDYDFWNTVKRKLL